MKAKGFDLGTIAQTETAIIELVHPVTGDEIGAQAEVYGQDSEIFKAESHKAEARYTEYSRRNKGKFMPPEERAAMDKKKVVICTKSITGLESEGKPFDDVAAIFEAYPCFHEQIVAGIMDRSNFIKGSSQK